jgi:hypothetical protein
MLYVKKSMAGAILFPIFFGPVGLLYASFLSGFLMSLAMLILAVIPKYRAYIAFLWIAGPYISVYITQKQALKTNTMPVD